LNAVLTLLEPSLVADYTRILTRINPISTEQHMLREFVVADEIEDASDGMSARDFAKNLKNNTAVLH